MWCGVRFEKLYVGEIMLVVMFVISVVVISVSSVMMIDGLVILLVSVIGF